MGKSHSFELGRAFAAGSVFAQGIRHELAHDAMPSVARAYSLGRAYAHGRALSQDAARWITVHPGGKGPKSGGGGNRKGRPCLIDGETGRVLGGMGGKFNGEHIRTANVKGQSLMALIRKTEGEKKARAAEEARRKEREKAAAAKLSRERLEALKAFLAKHEGADAAGRFLSPEKT